MATTAESPTLVRVDEAGGQPARGERIRARRVDEMSLSASRVARRAHVDRDTLKRVEAGDDGVRDTTLAAIERALDEIAEEMGMNDPERESGVVRFVVRGVYGAEALVVEGPVESIAELEASVDRIMRRLRGSEDGS